MTYPQHDKAADPERSAARSTVGEFIEWCWSNGYRLMKPTPDSLVPYHDVGEFELSRVLAAWQGIDYDAFLDEKEAIHRDLIHDGN